MSDHLGSAVFANESYVFAGSTRGDWDGTNAGEYDYVAFKVDTQGDILWKWQVNSRQIAMTVQEQGKLSVKESIVALVQTGQWNIGGVMQILVTSRWLIFIFFATRFSNTR